MTARSSLNDLLRRGASAIVVAVVMASMRSMIATWVEEADEGVKDEIFLASALGGPGELLPLLLLLLICSMMGKQN